VAYFQLKPLSPVDPGDVLIRRKHSGFGWHYATGLSNGLVKDVTPEGGKHITTWEGFLDGERGFIIRPDRTPYEKMTVEQRSLSTVGGGYDLLDNCEHDSNFSQTGVASSQTLNLVGGIGLLLLACKVGANLMAPKKPVRRRRR
jgi:hypothetical protein